MNYTMPSTDAFPWGGALILLAVFVAVTGGLIVLTWRRRWQFSLKWLFVYTALWAIVIPVVDRFVFRPRGGWMQLDGILEWHLVAPADREEFIELVTSNSFKLDCARHLAPRRTLDRLLRMPHQWELEEEEAGGQGWAEFRVGGLTRSEAELMHRWRYVWESETHHAAILSYFLYANEGRMGGLYEDIPRWSPTVQGVSFDYSPRTDFVRHGMLELIGKHPDRGVRAYCLRQLRAARALDERVGFAPDPLLEEAYLEKIDQVDD